MTPIELGAWLDEAEAESEWHWHCPPVTWQIDGDERRLHIEPDAPTDFWQRTHYGFQADNGHFLYTERREDFVLSGRVQFHPVHQYDQAGLMVRLSPECWLKTSVEFEPDRANRLGAVVTNNGWSDWSTQDFPKEHGEVWLRVRRESGDYLVEHSHDGAEWTQMRIARLSEDAGDRSIQCGFYACSPKGKGFVAEFSQLRMIDGRIG